MDKKVLYASIGIVLTVLISASVFIISKSKSKEIILTIDKVFFAYSSFIIDLGYSPETIKDLHSNQKNIAKWKGPYISQKTLDNYSEGEIQIIHASNIPTKKCSLDYLANCYTWIKVTNFSSSDYNEIKDSINKKANPFFANENLYFKVSVVE